MATVKRHGRAGGRPKGSYNKNKASLQEKANELGVDPFEILLLFAKRDWKALGYERATESRPTKDGGVIEVQVITPDLRLQAAREAAKYLYPQLKANGLVIAPVDEANKVHEGLVDLFDKAFQSLDKRKTS